MSARAFSRAAARGGVVLAAVLAVALAVLAVAPATESGTRWIAASIDRWAGGRVRIGEVSGRLTRTVHVRDFEVRLSSLDLTAAELELSLDPARLLAGEVYVSALAMDGVRLVLHETPAPTDAARPAGLPFRIAAPAVTVTNVTVVAAGEEIPVESVTLSTHLTEARLTLADLAVAGTTWRLAANGTVVPVEPFELDLHAKWTSQVDGVTQEGRLTIAGNAHSLDFDAAVRAPVVLRSSGRLRRTPQGYEVAATGAWRDLRWPLVGPPSVRSSEGRFELGGALDALSLALDLDLAADRLPATRLTVHGTGSVEPSAALPFELATRWRAVTSSDTTLSGELDASGDFERVVLRPRVLSPFAASAEAALTLGDEASYESVAQWSGLFWPLAGTQVVASPEGRLEARGTAALAELSLTAALEAPDRVQDGRVSAAATVSTIGELEVTGSFDWEAEVVSHGARLRGAGTLDGPPEALEVHLEGTMDSDTLPSAHVTLTGMLDETGLDLEPLLIQALGGRTAARGRIGWHPGIDWNLEVHAHGLDPGRRWPQWNGTLDAAAVVQGRMVDGAPRTTIDLHELQGRLRGHPIEGRGTVAMAGERLRARDVSLRSGDNRLALDGVYGREMDLEFSLDAPELSAVLPDAQGHLAAEGVLRGSIASPHLTMRLEGQDMRYRDWGARRVELDADISDSQSASKVSMQVEDARAGEHRIGSVELRADGTLAAHTAHATVSSSLGDLNLRLAGEMAPGRWLGELADATFIPSGGGTWRLAGASELGVDADRVRVERTCLKSDTGANACADFERTDHVRSSIGVEALPLSVLRPWLPAESDLTGALDAAGAWSLAGGRLEGNVAASVSPGALTVSLGQGERLSVTHADTELNVRVEQSRTEVDFRSVLGGDGPVRGRLLVEGPGRDASLDGTIEVSLPRLDPIAAFAAGSLEADGEAFIEARIGGTVAAPRARGVARIEVDRARIHDLGIELSDSRVEARADDGQRVAIAGVLRSGHGHLRIAGSGLIEAGGGWTGNELVLTGESFEIARLPEAVVTVSPDVTVAAVGDSLRMNGRVVVPWARITPGESPEGAVRVSGDEVLVNRTGVVSQPESGRGPDIVSDLVVALGDEVVLDGYGLLSRLAGELRVRHAPGGVTEAFGALDLVDGQFMLYGQRLDIEHGRVTFAGPIDDPGLDIRAVRSAGDTTAGIVIGGTVSGPSSRVYSEPPLDEAEALSLLLTGHTASSADAREAALLSQAALNLGLEGADRIGTRIRSTLGLDELRVGGIVDAGDASLVLGKRLSADLGVRYVRWLTRQAGSVFVNYRLTDHVSLEAESGMRQGLDLLFSIERDDASR